jgi:hypothetical protein
MQRAAAAHGADATAAAALDRLEQFRRDAVGADRVGAKGPLRTARDRLGAAESACADARRLHAEYLERSAALEAVQARVAQAEAGLRGAEAALASTIADEAEERLARAELLAARHPQPPPTLTARDELANEVAAALAGWAAQPHPPSLEGRSSDELEQELAALPEAPVGDQRPHPSVVDALHALDLADEALRTLGPEPAPVDQPPLPEDRLRDLARRLRTPQLPHVAVLEKAAAAARSNLDAAGPSRLRLALAAGGLAMAAGAVLLASGATPLGVILLALAVGLAGLGWLSDAGHRSAARRLSHAQAALAPYRDAVATADGDRRAAEDEARRLGLPLDPRQLDQLADRAHTAVLERAAAEEWHRRRESAVARRELAATALAQALRERDEEPGSDLRAAWERYRDACESRAEQATAAARRPLVERELSARRVAEERHLAERAAADRAESRLREAAASAGIAGSGEADDVAAALRGWQERQATEVAANQQALSEWHQLQSLLDGRSLEDLRSRARQVRQRAEAAAADAPADARPSGDRAVLERHVVQRREQLEAARREADELRGNLEARRESLPDVAEAEEAADMARRELERVEQLGRVVDETMRLLRAAEERVHRDVAPILAGAVTRWLPVVSDAAYTETSVDPATLAIRVKEAATGEWREARLLSEGTREQIYLLLRVAMAQHLVTTGEVAPLLLDEVTVQSDPERKRRLLDVLHALSTERQVVLFTHDDDVVSWAGEHLAPERDALVRLPGRKSGAAGSAVLSMTPGVAGLAEVGAAD